MRPPLKRKKRYINTIYPIKDTLTTMLYLIEPQHFEVSKTENAKFQHVISMSELLDKITYDGVEYNLYQINTNSMNVMFYATIVTSMDGNVVKNKITGAFNYLPEQLQELFDRHLKSAGGSETK